MNLAGSIAVQLQRYQFEKAHANIIHGMPGSATRTLRVSCEVRTLEGHHTLLFVLKSPGDRPGFHLGPDQRYRVRDDDFAYVEKWFTFAAGKDAYVRIVARSPSQPQARLELRNIVVAERLLPAR